MGSSIYSRCFQIYLFFLVILTFVECGVWKRSPEDVAKILETQIKPFTGEMFATDPVFIQHVDRANQLTSYTMTGEEEQVYERQSVDSGKDVVVLTADEDKLRFKKMKRTYVVLKKVNGTQYAASLALIRDAGSTDKDTVSIDGANRVVEWDQYDDHLIQGRTLASLKTLVCLSSMIVPCTFNADALVPADKFKKSPSFKAKSSPNNVKDEVESTVLSIEGGLDPSDNYDLYYDLAAYKVEGRGFFGDVGSGLFGNGLLPGLLGGTSAILCGVMALIGTCGHGKGGNDVTIVNESGQPVDPAFVKAQMGRRKRETMSAADFPGWKTQYQKITKGSYLIPDEAPIFVGFGNCPFKEPSKDLLASGKQDDVITFYRTALRTDCVDAIKGIFDGYLTAGILKLNGDKAFDLGDGHKYLSQPKLLLPELFALTGATELAAFSKVYIEHNKAAKSGSTIPAPDGKRKISKSTAFIGEVCLNYIKLAREKVRSHVLHLTRNLLLNLETIFTKLAQDGQNVGACADCTEDKEINLNDRIYIMALNQFIKRGLGPVEKGGDAVKSFETFYKANEDKFLKFVEVYS